MWGALKSIARPSARPPLHPRPQEQAEDLARQFAARTDHSQLPVNVTATLGALRGERQDEIRRALALPALQDAPITIEELHCALRGRANTAPGADGIKYQMLRFMGEAGERALLSLLNASWVAGELPAAWKQAIIVPIPKPQDRTAYRPISLLSCVGKTAERVILRRLESAVGPLHPRLFAYTRGVGTTECLLSFTDKVTHGKSVAVFLDLEKAFERADVTVILHLLAKKGVTGRLLRWVGAYLQDREASVRFQGHLSVNHSHKNGTPQGGILSPFLFNLLMDDLLHTELGRGVALLSYADDLALICPHPCAVNRAQTALSTLVIRCEELGLKLNGAKSAAMFFRGRPPVATLNLGGRRLAWSTAHRYLGVWFDPQLSFRPQVTYLRDLLAARQRVLRVISSLDGGAHFDVKRLFYMQAMRSLVDYSAPCLPALGGSLVAKLEVAQNHALRLILGAPMWTRVANLQQETGLPPVSVRIHQRTAAAVFKMTRVNRDLPCLGNVLHQMQLHPEARVRKSWARHAAEVVHSFGISDHFQHEWDRPNPLYAPPQPWDALPITFFVHKPAGPKAHSPPALLLATALDHIGRISRPDDLSVYTDGSVDPTTGAAGAALVAGDFRLELRLPDGSSTLQTELVGITAALMHALDTDHPRVVVHTDSLSAIRTLQSRRPRENVSLYTDAHTAAAALRRAGREAVINWVPGHVGLNGNELADCAAKAAAAHPNLDLVIPPSLGRVRGKLRQTANCLAKDKHQSCVEGGSPSAVWYSRATRYEPLSISESISPTVRTRLHRLRLGYKTTRQICEQFEGEECRHCEEWVREPLLHYILQCPATASLRPPGMIVPPLDEPEATVAASTLLFTAGTDVLAKLVSATPPPR